MGLKDIVDKILKDQNRSLSWLAVEMNKTFDGLKLSLVRGSLKYTDIKKMSEILKVSPLVFFEGEIITENIVAEERIGYYSLKMELDACKELTTTLKNQVADKEKIIGLLGGND